MATLLTGFVVLPRIDGVQINDAATLAAGLVIADKDADLSGAGEIGGFEHFTRTFVLAGLTAGQAIGLDCGTLSEGTNTFALAGQTLELRAM